VAHAEPDTSSRPSLNHRRCGRLKHILTTWIQSQKSVPIYGHTHYTVSCIVMAPTSCPSISRCFLNVLSRYCLGLVALTSRSSLDTVISTSQSRHSNFLSRLETLTSRYRLGLSIIRLIYKPICQFNWKIYNHVKLHISNHNQWRTDYYSSHNWSI